MDEAAEVEENMIGERACCQRAACHTCSRMEGVNPVESGFAT
jgi:hypothetical protein